MVSVAAETEVSQKARMWQCFPRPVREEAINLRVRAPRVSGQDVYNGA